MVPLCLRRGPKGTFVRHPTNPKRFFDWYNQIFDCQGSKPIAIFGYIRSRARAGAPMAHNERNTKTMTAKRRRGTPIDKIIGARLRAIRTDRGMSQDALGLKVGISFQQIQKYESGINAIASTHMPALCAALRIKPNDLFDSFTHPTQAIEGDTVVVTVTEKVREYGPRRRALLLKTLNSLDMQSCKTRKEIPDAAQ